VKAITTEGLLCVGGFGDGGMDQLLLTDS
jgi:hypothetical protein